MVPGGSNDVFLHLVYQIFKGPSLVQVFELWTDELKPIEIGDVPRLITL